MSDDLVVLVVDDDFHVGRLHAGFVNAVPGFTALTPVGTAEQAMRTVHAHQPDLVLLDVYLPDALGLDLRDGICRSLRYARMGRVWGDGRGLRYETKIVI